MLPRASRRFYRAQQRLSVVTVVAARRAWSGMGEDFDRSWATVGPRLVVLAAAAQLAAARNGAAYVPAALEETGQPNDPAGEVEPRAFAGTAPDGRTLDGLLVGAVVEAKTAVGQGSPVSEALARGGRWLDMATQTLVADAGRQASGVAIAARPRVGWVRMVNPPCCARCAILAGKFFRYNQGFQRHPRCDCTHIPSVEDRADDFRTDPQALVRNGQVTDLREAERRALDDGADLNQVVNSRRGRSGMTTTEGTTRRGLAGKRLGAPRGRRAARLSPEGIYAQASTREEAVDLLRQHGYLL